MTFLDEYETYGNLFPCNKTILNRYENVGKYIKFDKGIVRKDERRRLKDEG